VIASFVQASVMPDRWTVLGSREQGYAASLRVLNEGGPPLLGHGEDLDDPDERYAPVGVTDDQGAHLYVPLLAKLLGIEGALDALPVLYLAMFAVPLILYPLIFYGLFRSVSAAVIAPIGLAVVAAAIGSGSFGHADIYWAPAWAVLALLPPVLLVDRRWPRGSFAILLGIAVAASLATSIRSNAGLAVMIAVAIVILSRRVWSWPRRGGAVAAVVVAYLSISVFGLSAVRDYRDDWVDSPRFSEQASLTSHPVWHNAYIGLGYFPNDEGIFYLDSVASDTVERLDPDAGYVTPQYERVLREEYFDFVADNPVFFALSLGGKSMVTVGHLVWWLAFLVVLAPFALSHGSQVAALRRYTLLLLPAIALGLFPVVATVPYRSYELGLLGALALAAILLAASLAAEAERHLPAAARSPERRREMFAAARKWLTTPGFRRPAALAAVGLILVLMLSAVSEGVEEKANDWQVENGGAPLSERHDRSPVQTSRGADGSEPGTPSRRYSVMRRGS
jgi:hypothetical protein